MHSSDQAETAAEMFGLLLRHFRERAGLSQEQLGKRIGYSKSQVAMVERGARPPKGVFVQRADEVLGAQGALIVAAPKQPKQTERTEQRSPLPDWFTPFAEEEEKAWARHAYENHVMPGLLQTEAYARAVFTSHYPTYDDEIEAKVAARLERQKLLTRRPLPDISFVLEMVVLTRPIGGRRVMKAQLHHLADVARLRHVRIQLMDPYREDHAALDGPFVLLETDKRQQIAYIEGQGGSFFVTEHPELGNLFGKYGVTRAQAYTPERTLEKIEKMAEEL
ncbi:helix-turn-helix transcriptional regulator [Streptomyces sp. ME02-6991-2A]|uniref:helix-turn-helix domain-containing protein n=1 Tax=Streptomyces sp. ME02-6991-2A TaxID=3028677 RepID=UPI0029A7EFFD|nr:helix-turn-helix transcriptional regulator [Streptomyces sp. ME02-6991-2A]MDX3379322.1 helix-turn-helix transcriptional regulator [Streptomyces sp. ME02-6991-2A]